MCFKLNATWINWQRQKGKPTRTIGCYESPGPDILICHLYWKCGIPKPMSSSYCFGFTWWVQGEGNVFYSTRPETTDRIVQSCDEARSHSTLKYIQMQQDLQHNSADVHSGKSFCDKTSLFHSGSFKSNICPQKIRKKKPKKNTA